MPSHTFQKVTSQGRKDPCFKSIKRAALFNRAGDSSQNSSIASRSLTMYEKIFLQTPPRFSNRISKQNRRRRMNEVERCTNLEQREQYRLLIEKYRAKTLAETEKIFCFKDESKISPPVIDISNTSVDLQNKKKEEAGFNGSYLDLSHSVFASKSVSFAKLPEAISRHSNGEAYQKELKQLPEVVPAPRRLETSSSSKRQDEMMKTPISKIPLTIDWFSPSSPYLCPTFIEDLVSSFGRRERERKRKLAEEELRASLSKEKREMREEKLSELLKARLRVSSTPQVEEEEIEELSSEMENEVENALVPNPQNEVLTEKFNISITRQHISTLAGLNWLNDEVINFYMELIVQRSNSLDNLPTAHAMNTFFYPKLASQGYKSVRRWTKRVDIFSKDLVFFPIHLGIHWTLAVMDFKAKEINYYDSMGGNNSQCLEILRNYVASEHEDKKNATLNISDWKIKNKQADEIPQQLNGSDCGVFTCTFAEFIGRNSALNFHQDDMPLLRRTMIWEILNGRLRR